MWEHRAKHIAAPNYEYIKRSCKPSGPVTASDAAIQPATLGGQEEILAEHLLQLIAI